MGLETTAKPSLLQRDKYLEAVIFSGNYTLSFGRCDEILILVFVRHPSYHVHYQTLLHGVTAQALSTA
uniref:Uncharacterized protein n=1 Tax=Taeniopygia guttata TaxID=59729 RepID=A0A674GAS2_TAEGU